MDDLVIITHLSGDLVPTEYLISLDGSTRDEDRLRFASDVFVIETVDQYMIIPHKPHDIKSIFSWDDSKKSMTFYAPKKKVVVARSFDLIAANTPQKARQAPRTSFDCVNRQEGPREVSS